MNSLSLAVLCLCLALSVSANHIAYLSYYEGNNCNGNPLATIPIFPSSTGDTQLCAIPNTNDCVRALSGILASSGTQCDVLSYSDGDADDDEISFTEDGGAAQVRTFGECATSGTFSGCSLRYTDDTDQVLVGDDDDTSILDDDDIVGFLSYHGDSTCTTDLEFRAPIRVGGTTLCSSQGATTCSGDLRGVTLPASASSITCTTDQNAPNDECTISDGVSEVPYGECLESSIFPNCIFEYSNNYGNTEPCTTDNDDDDSTANNDDDDDSTANNDDDDDSTGNNDDDDSTANNDDDDDSTANNDDDDSTANNDDESSSGAAALGMSFVSLAIAFLI